MEKKKTQNKKSINQKNNTSFDSSKTKTSFSLSEGEKSQCVSLAKRAIESIIKNNSTLKLSEKEINSLPKNLLQKKACFVTLQLDGALRGCIGHLSAIQPLYKDIIENAVLAAFNDPRFPSLQDEEFPKLEIEVSIFTDPEELPFSDAMDLLSKIVEGKDGIIIQKGPFSATFLPSVWDELPNKEEFLTHLCRKAGLEGDAWKVPGLKVKRYYAIKAK